MEDSVLKSALRDSLDNQIIVREPAKHHGKTQKASKERVVEEVDEEVVLRRVREQLEAEDQSSSAMMAPYTEEIYTNLRTREELAMPRARYMDDQKDLTWEMRTILVQWMIEIHEHLRLKESSLYLAINMVDRFLSLRTATLSRLQLLGAAALFTASDYHWFGGPPVKQYLDLCENIYTKRDIFKAQRYLLDAIDWELNVPIILPFLMRGSRAEGSCMHYPPSKMAATCLWLARTIRRRGCWDQRMTEYTWYGEMELYSAVEELYGYLIGEEAIQETALTEKFSHRSFLDASGQCRKWIKEHPDIKAHFLHRREVQR
ncbi:cyclin-like protein [Piptocephalis cylindrospora]|uniref:Cyclin-like protein n=1 Tax=Piptocephalis cylindrospora TaxID=1907219 RepID=A0A4P9Y518_9FUNG|nr:cyclin-like protein [Piptocephalis cylindrospora]|eukprot:RKP14057.1 cyclin-like protein [Piptocephalis cylindrospora]